MALQVFTLDVLMDIIQRLNVKHDTVEGSWQQIYDTEAYIVLMNWPVFQAAQAG